MFGYGESFEAPIHKPAVFRCEDYGELFHIVGSSQLSEPPAAPPSPAARAFLLLLAACFRRAAPLRTLAEPTVAGRPEIPPRTPARRNRRSPSSEAAVQAGSEAVPRRRNLELDPLHCTLSPLPAYEPAFDWDNERSLIFGQRVPESLPITHSSGLKITVKVLSLSFQAGLVEPFSGTICLYNRDRREKLSEDFYFHMLPKEMQDGHISLDRRGIFSLDAPSPSICLLIQLEKSATEEGGVTPSVYSRKEPVHLTEKEKQKLQVWSRIMPYREPFAWAMIPRFENNHAAGAGDAASPSSPLAPSMSAASSQDSIVEPVSKLTLDGKLNHYSSGSSVIVEISNLNKVKESYIEDSLQDPKRKVHKPVKGLLKLEVEKLHNDRNDVDNMSEGGIMTNELHDAGELSNGRHSRNNVDGIHSSHCSGATVKKDTHQNGQSSNAENGNNFQAFDFRVMARSEPFSQLFHCLYVYPLTVSLSRKRIYLLLSDVSLPILRELVPHYLQENGKERMDYLEEGKTVFRLRLRLCSSLFPVNERIWDFFVEYDRHTLHTSPPWGSELLEGATGIF
ncbi:hypothetical protein ACQ4PT_004107 [Festuca glaucescens]